MSSPRNIRSTNTSSTQDTSSSPSLQPTQYGSPTIPQIPSRSELQIPNSNPGTPRNVSPFLSARPSPSPGATTSPNALAAQGAGGSSTSIPTLSSLPPSSTTGGNSTPLTEQQKAEIVRRHLLTAEDQSRVQHSESSTSVNNATATPSEGPGGDDEAYPTPYHLQGGDVVAGVYKWAAMNSLGEGQPPHSLGLGEGNSRTPSLRRSKSLVSLDHAGRIVSNPEVGDTSVQEGGEDEDGSASAMRVREILEPGGFRRDFVIRKIAEQRGEDVNVTAKRVNGRGSKSFIDFLSLYGHFGGEDLEEIEEGDEDEDEDEEDEIEYDGQVRGEGIPPYRGSRDAAAGSSSAPNERTPLVRNQSTRRGNSTANKGKRSGGPKGDATVTQAVLMLLKSFVGTGVLFLGKAFFNGGILFSTIVLCFIAMISLYSFLLLVETRLVVDASFGDIGGILFGKYMRWAILFSIVLSQIGFVAAYTIFVSQNLQAFIMAVTNCRHLVPIPFLILGQLIIFLPFAMIRNIQKLSGTALIADAFILFGLVYIFSNEISILANNGIADVALFNSKDFPLLIGTAVFSFEGIGLVIPITESMKDPHRFPGVLTGVMIGVMILFAGGGALAYAAYGSDIQTVVFVNLPQEDKFVNAAQFLYSIAILLSTPLQLFPAVRIMENGLFSRSGKYSNRVKWSKNTFRSFVVVGCSAVAWAGAKDLDKFVSLVGSLACVPLCFCYPAMLHYKACANTRKQKIIDGCLFVFGLFATVYTTSQTISMLIKGGDSAPPKFGKCS